MKRETFIKILSWLSFFTVSFGILSLVIFLIIRGISSLNLRLIFGTVPILEAVTGARPVWDGIWPAMAGTLLLLFVTMAIVIVPGISCGLWLSCFASERGRSVVGECVNVLAGIPSIVMGLFGLEVIILLRRTFLPNGKTCLLLSAFCLAVLVMPALVTAVRSAADSVPHGLKVTAYALGMSEAQTVRHIIIPSAAPGILGGVILAMGRAMEDTAVIMLTGVVANAGLPTGLTGKFEALPFRIYYTSAQYTGAEELAQGFGTALLLLLMSETLLITARILQRRLLRKWRG